MAAIRTAGGIPQLGLGEDDLAVATLCFADRATFRRFEIPPLDFNRSASYLVNYRGADFWESANGLGLISLPPITHFECSFVAREPVDNAVFPHLVVAAYDPAPQMLHLW